MGFDNEPPGKRARIDASPHHSSGAGTASNHATGSSITPAWRSRQHPMVATTNAVWASTRRQSAESIEAFFNEIDSERDAASSSHANGVRAPSYPASHRGLAQSLNNHRAAYWMSGDEIAAPTESQTRSDPAGESLAAFTIRDDELVRIGPASVLDLGDAEMPSPSGVQEQHVVGSPSPGSEVDDGSEADEGWNPYYSDSVSESESEDEVGPLESGPIQMMDMAELGRPFRTPRRPALTYYEMIDEAERLKSSITQKDLDEFYRGEFKEVFIRQKPLALLRALDLHGVSKLSDLQGAPKLPGSRRINLQALASDLDAPTDYLMRVYSRAVRYLDRRNEGAPAWMYVIVERFSLCERRKLKRLLNMPKPSNAGVVKPGRVLPFDEMLEEAKGLESSITGQELIDSFGHDSPGESIPRTLLALERALALHNVTKLGDLEGAPKLRGGRRIDGKLLAKKLRLKPNYFIDIRDSMREYTKKNEPTPDWMRRIMAKFSLNNLRGQPNADEAGGETLYSAMIEESKPLRPMITGSEIDKFFGDLNPAKDDLRRKILAFFRVLDEHNISHLKDVPGAPRLSRGDINAALVSRHLELKNDYLQGLRTYVRMHEIISKPASKWTYELLKRLSLDDGLRGGLDCATEDPIVPATDVPGPSNAGAFHQDAAPTYSAVLESARALTHSLSDGAIKAYFGQFRYADSINQRKVLAFILALDRHGATRLDTLIGYPAGDDGSVKLKEVADEIKMSDLFYFDKLPTTMKRYVKNGKIVPEWMKDVIDKFSVDRREIKTGGRKRVSKPGG